MPFTGKETGGDVGLAVLLISAEGEAIANPRQCRTAELQLSKAQKRLSRQKKRSHWMGAHLQRKGCLFRASGTLSGCASEW